MGADDFLNGRMAANFANSRAASDAHGAVVEWRDFSNKLQNKLNQTELNFVQAEASRIGFAHLFKTVVEELRRVDPGNPLIQKEIQLRMFGTKVAEKATEMGYIYDIGIGQVTGKR